MKPTADTYYRTGTIRRQSEVGQLEEEHINRIASRIVNVLTVIAAIATVGFTWRAYQWIVA